MEDPSTAEIIARIVKAASALTAEDQLTVMEDRLTALVSYPLVERLRLNLQALSEHIAKSKVTPVVSSKEEDTKIPPNVIITIRQYRGWGYDIHDFDYVVQKAKDYGDHDVLRWLVEHREQYPQVVKFITG